MRKTKAIIAVAATLLMAVSTSGCLKYTSNILQYSQTPDMTTDYYLGNNPTGYYQQPTSPYGQVPQTTAPMMEITTLPMNEIPTTPMQEITTVPGAITPTEPATQAAKDPSQWSTAEIVDYLNKSVNNTKAYKGNLAVTHTEHMEATVTKCPGGSVVKNIANGIVEGALEETNETLNYANGQATNGEGETVQIVLPKNSGFSLSANGVASASASKSGNIVTVKVQLVSEKGTMSTAPAVNKASVGFLDMNSVDLSAITVTVFDTVYSGTVIEMTIDDSTGHVKSAAYTVPVEIHAEGKAMGISASVDVTAKEYEKFVLNW